MALLKTLVDIQKQDRKGQEFVRKKRHSKIKKFSVPQIQVNIKHDNREQIYDNYSRPVANAQANELALTSEAPIRNEAEEKDGRDDKRRLSLKGFCRTPLSRLFKADTVSARVAFSTTEEVGMRLFLRVASVWISHTSFHSQAETIHACRAQSRVLQLRRAVLRWPCASLARIFHTRQIF